MIMHSVVSRIFFLFIQRSLNILTFSPITSKNDLTSLWTWSLSCAFSGLNLFFSQSLRSRNLSCLSCNKISKSRLMWNCLRSCTYHIINNWILLFKSALRWRSLIILSNDYLWYLPPWLEQPSWSLLLIPTSLSVNPCIFCLLKETHIL